MTVEFYAKDFEEAYEITKSWSEDDVVDLPGETLDSSTKLTGLFE